MKTREHKTAEVADLRDRLARANAVILADYRGLTVSEANDLRTRLRTASEGAIDYRVAKNTLLRIAVAGTPAEGVTPMLVGPNAVAIAYDEPSALAKALVDYSKDNEKFEIRGGYLDGDVVDLDAIRALAALPGKDELRAMLAATIRSPMQNLASTLHGLLGNVRNALERRMEQLEN